MTYLSLSLRVIKIILDHTQRERFVVQVISQIYKEALNRIHLVWHKILKPIDITLGSIYFKLAIISTIDCFFFCVCVGYTFQYNKNENNSCKLWLFGHLVHSVYFIHFSHLDYLCWLGYLCFSCWLEYLSQIGHLLLLNYWMLICISWLPFTCLIICAKWLHYVDWVICSSLSFKQKYHLRLPEFEAF